MSEKLGYGSCKKCGFYCEDLKQDLCCTCRMNHIWNTYWQGCIPCSEEIEDQFGEIYSSEDGEDWFRINDDGTKSKVIIKEDQDKDPAPAAPIIRRPKDQ